MPGAGARACAAFASDQHGAVSLLSLPNDLLTAVFRQLPAEDVLSVFSTRKDLFSHPGVPAVQATAGISRFYRARRRHHLPPGWTRDFKGRTERAAQLRDELLELLGKFDARYGTRDDEPLRCAREHLHYMWLNACWLEQRLWNPYLVLLE